MKSMLQQLDSNHMSNENIIHEQNGRLLEKDKIIQNNKAELERLEKKAKTQEHKVRDKTIQTSWIVRFVNVLLSSFKVPYCRK